MYKNIKKDILTNPTNTEVLKENYSKSHDQHRRLVRAYKAKDSFIRDQKLHSILSRDPSSIFKSITRSKRAKAGKITRLTVKDKIYLGDSVKDGFFDSISNLKTFDAPSNGNSEYFENILEICCHGPPIPTISEKESFDLLQKMKAEVSDLYGITANHFNSAGPAGWKNFNILFNSLISNVNNTDIVEINEVYACVLFKGHGKDKNSDRSYRTISTCHLVAKALDLHIRSLHVASWNLDQAETQFQGEGSSHELAATLLTETIQHSLFTLKEPIFVLLLDA